MDDGRNNTPEEEAIRIAAVKRWEENQRIRNNPFLREMREVTFPEQPSNKSVGTDEGN